MTFVVGLTGGIGSGKTTAGAYFEQLGIQVINADIVARGIVENDSKCLAKISYFFGKKSLFSDGSLNRGFIRTEIFDDPKKRIWLEALLHPPIRKKISSLLELSASKYTILESPLLLETDQCELTNRILIIDLPEHLQIHRTSKRDGSQKKLVESIIESQMQRTKRLELGNDIVTNIGSIGELKSKLLRLHNSYLVLAKSHI
jgi:dephospho-CoA kinase